MAVSSVPFPARPRLARDWAGRIGPLGLICLAHAALLVWLAGTLSRPPVVVSPPSVVGELVSETPEPEARPKPQPKPVVQPRPAARPPLPKAPPSERAVSAPPPTPETVSPPSDSPVQPAAAPPAAAPSPSDDAPVTPPRSDASALNNPAPEYPRQSRALHEQGRVLLDVYILADGTIGQIRLRSSSGYARLDNAALDAVRRWHYVPARRGDEPIPYWYVQPIAFELNR